MENDKKLRNFVKTTIREFINEQFDNNENMRNLITKALNDAFTTLENQVPQTKKKTEIYTVLFILLFIEQFSMSIFFYCFFFVFFSFVLEDKVYLVLIRYLNNKINNRFCFFVM